MNGSEACKLLRRQPLIAQEKSWVKAVPGKEREKVALRREKGALLTLNRTEQHQASTEGIVATEKKREERKRSNTKDPYDSAKKNTVTKDKQLGGRPQQCP